MTENIILIGMPGSGKSTVGVQLAKALALNFIDSDLVIQNRSGKLLQAILEESGYQALRDVEAETLLSLTLNNDLLATGGSAVYSDAAMQHLASQGTVVYLKVTLDTVLKRIDNEGSRGIARPEGHTLADVYAERTPLYERYADITFDNNQPVSIASLIKVLEAYEANKKSHWAFSGFLYFENSQWLNTVSALS